MRVLEPWRGTPRLHTPVSVVATYAQLRQDGDWLGACTAAGFQVDIDLDNVAARYGRRAHKRVESDLSALAPDLLRRYLGYQDIEFSGDYVLSPKARPYPWSFNKATLTVRRPRGPNGRRRPRLTVNQPDELRWPHTLTAHTEDEIAREFVLGGLTGPMLGCALVCHKWLTGEPRLPKRLRRARHQFFRHVWYGHTDDVVDMVDAGFDLSVVDPAGASLLHHLYRLDEDRLWPRIQAAGLPLNARDHEGRTPLHYAADADAPGIMALLVNAGADPRLIDHKGRPPDDVLPAAITRPV